MRHSGIVHGGRTLRLTSLPDNSLPIERAKSRASSCCGFDVNNTNVCNYYTIRYQKRIDLFSPLYMNFYFCLFAFV